jgi:hypothetical protein
MTAVATATVSAATTASATVSAAAAVSAAVPAAIKTRSAPAGLIEYRCPESRRPGPAERTTATGEGSVATRC